MALNCFNLAWGRLVGTGNGCLDQVARVLHGGGDGGCLHKDGVMVMRRPTVLALDVMLGPDKRETWVTCLELLQKIQLMLSDAGLSSLWIPWVVGV